MLGRLLPRARTSLPFVPSMAVSTEMDPWEEYLVPKFDVVVSKLKVDLFLDTLRSRKLVTRTEYSQIRKLDSDEQARVLLNDILPKKGPSSFSTFCNVLLGTPGQDHIVSDVLRLSTPSTLQPESHVQAAAPPRKRTRGNVSPPGDPLPSTEFPSSKRATFYFKTRHRHIVQCRIKKLYTLCEGSLRVPNSGLKVFFEGDPCYEEDLVDETYVFESEDEKLVSLVVHGVAVGEVEEKHPEVLDSIAAWLGIPRSKIEVIEVMDGSAVVILNMEVQTVMR